MTPHDDKVVPEVFRLPSNRGRALIEGRLVRVVVIKSQRRWIVGLRGVGRSFKRDGSPPGELVEDYDFRLPQVEVSEEGVEALIEALGRWLNGGLKGEEEFELDIGSGDSVLHIEVRTREDVICRPDTPAFYLRYDGGLMRVEVVFAVDHSCLNELAVDLGRILALARAG